MQQEAATPSERKRKKVTLAETTQADSSSSRPARDEGAGADATAKSSGDNAGRPVSPTRGVNGRLQASAKRTELMQQRANAAKTQQAGHERRRIRGKIATIMLQVRKRQDLHQQQEKAKVFREQRFAMGFGPKASLGDADEFALGLTCLSASSALTSPRRTALLESLTLHELGVVREQPEFFFTGNAIAEAVPAEPAGQTTASGHPLSGSLSPSASLSGTSNSGTGKAKNGLWAGSVDAEVFEDLIEFFTVSRADKKLDVSIYAQKLREQLQGTIGLNNPGKGGGAHDIDWRAKLCRGEPEESPLEEQSVVDDGRPLPALEMMPSLGRHPCVRQDHESPTLSRVQVVNDRREAQDAAWVDERRERIARRLAMNAFKAREQQREQLLSDFRHKELHKVRMMLAEEKKAMIDSDLEAQTELQSIQKIYKLMHGIENSERKSEEKSDFAQKQSQQWHAVRLRAAQRERDAYVQQKKEGVRLHERYMEKLEAIAYRRDNVGETHWNQNEKLKTRIQGHNRSNVQQEHDEERSSIMEDTASRQEAAAQRRHCARFGNRYCFVEKAFGAGAVGFDAKHHSLAVDRRGKSWQKNAEAWSKIQNSFSAPAISAARPLSPGGVLSESGFKTLSDAGRHSSAALA